MDITPKHFQITGAVLKRIACITMFIDHLCVVLMTVAASGQPEKFGPGMTMQEFRDGPYRILEAGRMVGRIAFPIYAFLLTEGFFRTSDRRRYFLRLCVFAVLSEYVFDRALYPGHPDFRFNVYVTLALGFLVMWITQKIREKELFRKGGFGDAAVFAAVAAAGCLAAQYAIPCDYRWGGVLLVALLYYFHGFRDAALAAGYTDLVVFNGSELWSFPGFLLCRCYNGIRGKQHKYLYYLFYPLHLGALCVFRYWWAGF